MSSQEAVFTTKVFYDMLLRNSQLVIALEKMNDGEACIMVVFLEIQPDSALRSAKPFISDPNAKTSAASQKQHRRKSISFCKSEHHYTTS